MPTQQVEGSSWKLVDQGKNGAIKLGYVSSRVGDVLRIGPLWPPAGSLPLTDTNSTVPLIGKLGFLSSTRSGQGALRIHCVAGCTCRSIRGLYAKKEYPFPYVDTRHRAADSDERHISITLSTTFCLKLNVSGGSPGCFVEVTHKGLPDRASSVATSGASMPIPDDGNSTHVRVDYFILKSDLEWRRNWMFGVRAGHTQR